MNKFIKIILTVFLMFTLCGCSNEKTTDTSKDKSSDFVKLSFKDALSYKYLKTIDNKTVQITGYMATTSPVDGSFIFLMNLPYQSCPFCKPNTSELSNTMEVYPKNGKQFEYTEMAITITGTLVVSESEEKPFTDLYGYEFNFKIVDASYRILDESEISDEVSLWQQVASSSLINDVYSMLDFVNFTCLWPTYFVNSWEDIDGNINPGYYLYASDAQHYIYTDDAQYNYGTKSNYFSDIIKKAKNLDQNKFEELIKIINRAEDLSIEALKALNLGEYTCQLQYVEKFDIEDYIYTLNKADYFEKTMDTLYNDFLDWFAGFLDELEM